MIKSRVFSHLQPLVAIPLFIILIKGYPLFTSVEANTIPRSTSSRSIDPSKPTNLPPWNSSPHIDSDGFISSLYRRIHGEWEEELRVGGKWYELDEPVYIRQVPGDGACLFHSCSVALALVANKTHIDMTSIRPSREKEGSRKDYKDKRDDCDSEHYDLTHLYHYSRYLRKMAVDVLSQNPRRLLYLQGNEYLRARDLVLAAASQYDLSPEEYCNQMRNDSYWGGGPEICALVNALKRPIHVYELYSSFKDDPQAKDVPKGGGDTVKRRRRTIMPRYEERDDSPHHQFRLRRMACFGSPKFDKREPLNILSADCRFPDIEPGQQITSGNHFLALFPESLIEQVEDLELERLNSNKYQSKRKYKRTGIRGGHDNSSVLFYDRRKSKNDRIQSTVTPQLSIRDRFKQSFVYFFPFTTMNDDDDDDYNLTTNDHRGFYQKLFDRLKLIFLWI